MPLWILQPFNICPELSYEHYYNVKYIQTVMRNEVKRCHDWMLLNSASAICWLLQRWYQTSAHLHHSKAACIVKRQSASSTTTCLMCATSYIHAWRLNAIQCKYYHAFIDFFNSTSCLHAHCVLNKIACITLTSFMWFGQARWAEFAKGSALRYHLSPVLVVVDSLIPDCESPSSPSSATQIVPALLVGMDWIQVELPLAAWSFRISSWSLYLWMW